MSRGYCCIISSSNIKTKLMNDTEATIENLGEELEKLCLRQRELEEQQRELSRAINVICVLIGRLTHRVNQGREPPPPLQQELILESGIYKGDMVEVINPSKGQEKKGKERKSFWDH